MPESRLARRSLKQNRKQLYTSLAGIVGVIFFAFVLGPTLIGAFGDLIDRVTGKSSQQEVIKPSDEIQPPSIDALPVATPSARIKVTGKSDYPNGEVELHVNGSLYDVKGLDDKHIFEFDDVLLNDGDNLIKARLSIGDKKSDFSEEKRVSYTKKAPKLELSFPQDRQSFTKADQQINVRGTTDPENSVNVNGFVAIVDSVGNFAYNLNLHEGENKIMISAKNSAGNTTDKEIIVSYSP